MRNTEAVTTFVRHPKYYSLLGDLVVQSTPDADGTCVVFRVSQSTLAFSSVVFAGMFTLPVAAEGRELYDGVPIVRMTDTANDLEALFTALHDPSSLSPQRFDPDIPVKFAGVMRIATKYQIETIRQRVIDIMHDNWPQTFEQWLRFQAEVGVIKATHAAQTDGLVDGKSFEERIPEPASAIRFARDFDVPSILPFATYVLAGIQLDCDWDKARAGDMSGRLRLARHRGRSARWSLLDIADYRSLIAGREKLGICLGSEILFPYTRDDLMVEQTGTISCTKPSGDCSSKVYGVVALWQELETKGGVLSLEAIGSAAECPDPLRLLDDLRGTQSHWGICESCQKGMMEHIRYTEMEIWEQICARRFM